MPQYPGFYWSAPPGSTKVRHILTQISETMLSLHVQNISQCSKKIDNRVYVSKHTERERGLTSNNSFYWLCFSDPLWLSYFYMAQGLNFIPLLWTVKAHTYHANVLSPIKFIASERTVCRSFLFSV